MNNTVALVNMIIPNMEQFELHNYMKYMHSILFGIIIFILIFALNIPIMFKHEPQQKDSNNVIIYKCKKFQIYENIIKLLAVIIFLILIILFLQYFLNLLKSLPVFGFIFSGLFGIFFICIALEALYKAFQKPINNDFTNKEIKDIIFNSLIFGFFIDFGGLYSYFFQIADNFGQVLWIKDFIIISTILIGYFLNIFFVSINILLLLRRLFKFCTKINFIYKIKNLISISFKNCVFFNNSKEQYYFLQLSNTRRIKYALLIIPTICMDIIKSVIKTILMFISLLILSILSSLIIIYHAFKTLFIKPIICNKDTTFLQMTSRFAFILSFLITLGILNYEKLINDSSINILEFIGSVIIIPLIITQIINMNQKEKY